MVKYLIVQSTVYSLSAEARTFNSIQDIFLYAFFGLCMFFLVFSVIDYNILITVFFFAVQKPKTFANVIPILFVLTKI